jgi:hypothetical protein
MKLSKQTDHVSPLAQFKTIKAAQKKRIYMQALKDAKQNQLNMMEAGKRILKEQQHTTQI